MEPASPSWPILAATIGSGLLTAGLGAFATAWVSRRGQLEQSRRHLRERLRECYWRFIDLAMDDLHRALRLRAAVALGSSSEAPLEQLDAAERDRPIALAQLKALQVQIGMLEPEKALRELVDRVISLHPILIISLPAPWGQGNCNERFDEFGKQCSELETSIDDLRARLLRRYTAHQWPSD